MSDPAELKAIVLRLAREQGFAAAGVAPAEESPRAERFMEFLRRGCHADMTYLARNPKARCDPRSLLEGAAAVICLAASYAPAGECTSGVARYARGRDYHRVLAGRCRKIVAGLASVEPSLRARVCVDTSPLLERHLATSAGLGWIGRNGCLIDERLGSYLLLAEIVVNLPLPADSPAPARCWACRACMDACPTGAIGPDGLVDSRRCVSYLTIECRGSIPEELRLACGERLFGCDVCQEVCPWNRPQRLAAGDAELLGPTQVAFATAADVLAWSRDDWDRATRGSAARRARWEMFLRNAAVAAGNAGEGSVRPVLARLCGHPSDVVREAAQWALRRLDAGRRGKV